MNAFRTNRRLGCSQPGTDAAERPLRFDRRGGGETIDQVSLRAAIDAGRMSVSDAAAQAAALRNRIMELARRRSSPTARAHALWLKRDGRSVAELSEKYARRLYGNTFSALSAERQASVLKEIIQASGRPDEGVKRLALRLGRTGRRTLLVSLAAGVCAATAPVCVGAIAFVGGLLATHGAEASFGSLYPRPTR